MNVNIRHTGLVVANLDKAMHFWSDVLGFEVLKQMEESGKHMDAILGLIDVKVTTVKLTDNNNNILELLYFHSHPDTPAWKGNANSTGFTHIALTVEDIDSTCEKLSHEGMIFFSPPQYSPDGYAKVTYGRGPEGILIELVEVIEK